MCIADVHVHMPLLADAVLHLGIAGQGSFFAQILRIVIFTASFDCVQGVRFPFQKNIKFMC